MNPNLSNGVALAVALIGATLGVTWRETAEVPQANIVTQDQAPSEAVSELVDARGNVIPVRSYQRIVSLNLVADRLLLELVEPERVVAVTQTSAEQHPDAWRFSGRPGLARADELEVVLGLEPDLVVASRFADESLLQRLRDEGIAVFDLGEMRGVDTTLANLHSLGVLLDEVERAERLEIAFRLQLDALEGAVPPQDRVEGLYVSVYGDHLYGGTQGSSYADLLQLAGVHDVAADHGYTDWPEYSAEELLVMDPPLLITQADMGAVLCRHATLRELRACQPGGRVVEVPGRYHSDPGLGVVQASYGLLQLVHPGASAEPSGPRTRDR